VVLLLLLLHAGMQTGPCLTRKCMPAAENCTSIKPTGQQGQGHGLHAALPSWRVVVAVLGWPLPQRLASATCHGSAPEGPRADPPHIRHRHTKSDPENIGAAKPHLLACFVLLLLLTL
jgi:hypothetical protein